MRNLLRSSEIAGQLRSILSKVSDMDNILNLREKGHNIPINFMEDRIMGTLFLEPSTRTQVSFETAMMRMGGKVVRIPDHNSSLKGESFLDTIKTMSQYVDVLVTRTPSHVESWGSTHQWGCRVINGGDGDAEHPTQALIDVYTIEKEFGRISNLDIAIVGDLEKGRTVHSLIEVSRRNFNNRFFLYGNDLPERYSRYAETIKLQSEDDLFDILPKIDILYLTRTQTERDGKIPPKFQLSEKHMNLLSEDSLIMHPMPRTSELHPKFDEDPRCIYFQQSKNGVPVRMAILDWIFY